jgi:hypothetical protein
MNAVRDDEDLVRLETESLGRESKHPDPASAAITAMLVSLGQTAPAILSTDNESVRFSDMVLIAKVGSRCIGTPFAAVATCHRTKRLAVASFKNSRYVFYQSQRVGANMYKGHDTASPDEGDSRRCPNLSGLKAMRST